MADTTRTTADVAALVPRQPGPPAIENQARTPEGAEARRPVRTRSAVVPGARLETLFGVRLAALRLHEVVDLATIALEHRTRLLVGVLNAAKLVKLRRDVFLRESLLECDLLLADGQSIVWASRVLGGPLPERVTGIDLFSALLDLAHRDRRRIYLLGATQDVLDQLVAAVGRQWPDAVVAGSHHGYFADHESAAVAAAIADSKAEMLFLGMPTPRKETFLRAHGAATGAAVLHGVGGSFDVLAGLTKRAPERWQRMGLEWAYRLVQEPRRLWRRYLVTNTVFVGVVVRELLHPQKPYEPAEPHHHSTTSNGGN